MPTLINCHLSHKPVYKGGFKAKQANVPDHDPPPGYICYRCHEKGNSLLESLLSVIINFIF